MALKVDLKQFLDENGNELALTAQARTVFNFISKIVLAVTEQIEQPLVEIDLKCATRAENLNCEGSIEANYQAPSLIHWQCDCCEANGSILNWQFSKWDKQLRVLH